MCCHVFGRVGMLNNEEYSGEVSSSVVCGRVVCCTRETQGAKGTVCR
jgi:hypothetical protein